MAKLELHPNSLISLQNDKQLLKDYFNVITSKKPNNGNLKYSFITNDDIDFLSQFKKRRELRDETTTHYVKTFLKGDKLSIFVMYMYQTLYYNILSKVNTVITEGYACNKNILTALPLQPDEEIKLYFKGGTTMYFLFNDIYNSITPQLQSNLQEMKKNFDTSDTDMGIEINCKNEQRYLIIRNAISSIIIETLDIIGKNFDFMINDNTITNATTVADLTHKCGRDSDFMRRNDNPLSVPSAAYTFVNNTDMNLLLHNIQMIKLLLVHSKYSNDNDILKLLRDNNIINPGNDFINCPDNPVICGMLIELIDYYLIMSKNASHVLTNVKVLLTEGATYMKYHLYLQLHNMYSVDNKKDFVDLIVKAYNSDKFKQYHAGADALKNIYYESFSSGMKIHKRLNVDVKDTDLSFVTRKDFILQANDDPYLTSKITEFDMLQKIHYTSVNTGILEESDTAKTDFTLYRIKLNIKLDTTNTFVNLDNLESDITKINVTEPTKKILVPSEILDVTISGYKDSGHHYIINRDAQFDIRNFTITGKQFSLYLYGIENHINDLNHVLFKQRGYIPWTDGKYKKRIDRLLFFIINKISLITDRDDKMNFIKLLDIFIDMKKSITQISTNPDIYELNKQSFMSNIPKLLKYIINKEDYNFFNINSKYNSNNLSNSFFTCYNFNSSYNLFEKIINFILTWSCILINTSDMNNNIFNNVKNENIDTITRVLLIQNIYTGNGIYINFMKSGISAFYVYIIQHFLSYMWNLGSKLELLRTFIV